MKNGKWKMKKPRRCVGLTRSRPSRSCILHFTFCIPGAAGDRCSLEPMLPASLAAGLSSGPAHVDQVAVVADRKGLSQLRLDGRPRLGGQCRTALRAHAPEREKLVGPDVRWQVAIVRPFV